MESFYNLVNYLETYDFSIELIDSCKDVFQFGGWNNEDFERFSKLFYQKVNKSCPLLSKEKIEQILDVIYNRGCLTLKDILFIDGAAFSVNYSDSHLYNGNKKADYVRFVWNSKKYRWCDFLDTTFFFNHQELNKMDKSILPKLREEINDLFVNYFGILSFPKELGMNEAICQEYAIFCDASEVKKSFVNRNPFDISIICKVLGQGTVRKLDINCNINNKKIITVVNIDDNVERLSEIIERYRCLDFEEKRKCIMKRKTK